MNGFEPSSTSIGGDYAVNYAISTQYTRTITKLIFIGKVVRKSFFGPFQFLKFSSRYRPLLSFRFWPIFKIIISVLGQNLHLFFTASSTSDFTGEVGVNQRTLTDFVRGSITALLTSCLTGLDSTKQVNLLLIQLKQSC